MTLRLHQRIENYMILPRIMGKAIDLSAPTVIITLLIGSSLAGLGGASDRAPDRRCPQGRHPGGPAEHPSALRDRVGTFRFR